MATGRVPTTANSPLTAKGDLFGYSTTQARVAVGSDGDTLVADSASSTGLRWQSAKNTNAIINGAFDVWQRGTSFASSTFLYTADRFVARRSGSVSGATFSRQSAGLDGFQYCFRAQRDSGNSATNLWQMFYTMETADSIPFVGKTVVFSFYARAGADYSASGGTLSALLTTGTGTDQAVYSFTSPSDAISISAALTTSWQRFQGTATIPTGKTEIGLQIYATPTGTAGANDYFEITGIQVECGSVATTFNRAGGGTLQGERAACERYYQRWEINNYVGLGSGWSASTTVLNKCFVPMKVTMRTTPTIAQAGLGAYGQGGTYGLSITTNLSTATAISFDGNSTGLTADRNYIIGGRNSVGAYFEASAEL